MQTSLRSAIIYVATCSVNGKKYVGFTSQELKRRIWQHKYDAFTKLAQTPFHKALRKYGLAAFVFEAIMTGDPAYLCEIEEPRLIEELQTRDDRFGYNLTSGGEGRRDVPPWNKGIPRTDAEKDLMRRAATGKKQSQETVAKRVSKTRGLKRSEETRERLSSEWEVVYPNSDVRCIRNLSLFCVENELILSNMIGVANGARKQHKGFRCRRIKDGAASRR